MQGKGHVATAAAMVGSCGVTGSWRFANDLGLKRQLQVFELLFGFLRGFQIFLSGRKRLMAEPFLDRANCP
jgi:hypothetical protein